MSQNFGNESVITQRAAVFSRPAVEFGSMLFCHAGRDKFPMGIYRLFFLVENCDHTHSVSESRDFVSDGTGELRRFEEPYGRG